MRNKLEESKEKQRQIVTAEEGKPIYVKGKAGTGKRAVLEARARELLKGRWDRKRVLIFTFSNITKFQIQCQFRDLLIADRGDYGPAVQVKTFYEFCYGLLESHGFLIGINKMPYLIKSDSDRKEVLKDTLYYKLNSQKEWEEYQEVIKFISEIKCNCIAENEIVNYTNNEQRILAYWEYQDILESQNLIDEDGLILKVYELMAQYPQVARLASGFKGIFVSEAENLNEAQYELLKILTQKDYNGNLMMTSDPEQLVGYLTGSCLRFADENFVKDFKPDVYEI